MSRSTRLSLIFSGLGFLAAAYVLGYLASGGSLSHTDQILWLVIALIWVAMAFWDDARKALAEKRSKQRCRP